jgi:2-oxoisovalerate dehydrogenase E1 component
MYFTNEKQLKLYKSLLLPRLIEEKMMILLRQGKISKWFSGIGQEAISVGATEALQKTDFILPLHRNLGVFTSRGVPLDKLFLQWQGKKEGFTKGRDRSFHFGSLEHRIIGMISHLGAMLGVADGLALASNLLKEKNNKLVQECLSRSF